MNLYDLKIGGVKTSGRSTSKRRSLIQAYNDEEGEAAPLPPTSQPIASKEQPTPLHELDIDMELENVSPEHRGSSPKISTSQDECIAAPNQAATSLSRLDITNLAEATPPPNHGKKPTTDTQSAKRRRSESGRNAINTGMSIPQSIRSKETI